MWFYIVRELLAILVWLLFADKKRWRELLLVGMFAGFVGATTDNALMADYKLWEYVPKRGYFLNTFDDFGTYTIVTYLFIQRLPKQQTFWRLLPYFFMWTLISISIEWIHLKTGHMIYHKWWRITYSYLADWFLFWVFYMYHKLFRLQDAFQHVQQEW